MPRKSLPATILFLLACPALAAAAQETDYFAVFASGSKVGHMVDTRSVNGGRVTTASTMAMSAERLGAPFNVTVTQEHVETTDGRPLAFKSSQDLSIMSQTVEGTITAAGKCDLVVGAAGQTEKRQMDWPPGALLSEGALLLQKRMGLKEGTKYSFVTFEPTSLRGLEVQVQVGGRKDVDILGRPENLTEMVTQTAGVTIRSYVDDQYKARKTITAEAGMNLEIVACTKEYALGQDASVDLVAKAVVPSPVVLEHLAAARSVTYHLVPSPKARLAVPAFDNQQVTADPSGLTITVTAQGAPANAGFPYSGTDVKAIESLKPSRFLECDQPDVVALARRAVGATAQAGEATRRIETFVRNYITNKDLSVGYASAAEVVKTHSGDCSEHAVLAAAMCRAVGIPAQVVAGMLYLDDMDGSGPVFGPHAWVRVLVAGKWYNIDAASKHGYDLGHIAMAAGDGNPADYLGLVELMGAFRIDRITVQPMTAAVKSPASQKSSPD